MSYSYLPVAYLNDRTLQYNLRYYSYVYWTLTGIYQLNKMTIEIMISCLRVARILQRRKTFDRLIYLLDFVVKPIEMLTL